MVPRGDRSGAVIEPYLTDQWYVKVGPLAEPAIRAVEDGRIRFVPENWSKTYFEWMRNIEDWCISRQIWWGHRIPAWYDDQGNIFVGRSEAEVRERHGLGPEIALTQDEDVLDTWFSSALWPFSTLGWPEETPELQRFYPTSVLVTGFDIIFFWVARMIMMGLRFMDGEPPFREIYIHGLVRDGDGQKMSKSKGNVLDPIDIIDGIDLDSLIAKRTAGLMQPTMERRVEEATRRHFPDGIASHGSDALRFTFASLATTGRDVVFDMGRADGYRNFCNKIWNAARYVLMNTEGRDCGTGGEPVTLSVADRWIISRLQDTKAAMNRHIGAYRFDLAAQALYDYVWSEYCDWYLELSKPILLNSTDEPELRGTRQTLVRVLETILRLAHPFMPFISEEIWQRVAPLAGRSGETVMLQPYPRADDGRRDAEAERDVAWIQGFILGVRRIRGEMDIAPGKPLPVLLNNGDQTDRERLQRYRLFLERLARLESIGWLDSGEETPESAIALVGEMQVLVPMAGLIDKDAELRRLSRDRDRARADLERAEKKLANPNFVEKAPAAVVEQERQRLADFRAALEQLETQYRKIERL